VYRYRHSRLGRLGLASLVALATLTACVTWPDDIQSGLNRPRAPNAGASDARAAVLDGGTEQLVDGGPTNSIEAGPTDCPAQDVTWTAEASSCSATLPQVLLDGTSRELTDSTVPDTGKVSVLCSRGTLVFSTVVCEPPRVFDVSGPTGCVRGFCDAVKAGTCSGDPARAKALCIYKGYADQVDFKTAPGTIGGLQCTAGGESCYTSQNACNAIFTSVTCRH
jgi:hypothetical protein